MGIKVRQMLEESKMKTQVKLAASDTGNLQELKIQEICKIICDGQQRRMRIILDERDDQIH